MKALLHTAPFQLAYTEVSEPKVGEEEVLVRVQACGICGSDVQGYTGRTGRRIPPLIMGHEAAGLIEAVGAGVQGLRPGDRVCFDSTVYCNTCPACQQGQYNHCQRREVLGVSVPAFKRHGAFAERVVLPWWTIIRMPEALSFTQAALLEPASIGLHAVHRGQVAEGETVAIIGAGTIGLMILQAARLKGAARILISDKKEARLALAKALGTDGCLNPDRDNVSSSILNETGGRGADVSFEAVGFAPTLRQAMAVTRTGGRVVLVGNLQRMAEIDVQAVVSKELTLRGTYASGGEYRTCVDLVASGQIQVLPFVSETLPLAQGSHAFDRLYQGQEDLLKIILQPA